MERASGVNSVRKNPTTRPLLHSYKQREEEMGLENAANSKIPWGGFGRRGGDDRQIRKQTLFFSPLFTVDGPSRMSTADVPRSDSHQVHVRSHN